ncbi:hypothetical protein [Brevundimonas sp. NIBR11]|uniref:hypothetical protein n=1 Tax=Brevundimonas sp. NIBR11 TaxID=3015999 RepID=UPI0022F0E53A|nr:hypothetical protein [Brevundimonas sp. NIBR11]
MQFGTTVHPSHDMIWDQHRKNVGGLCVGCRGKWYEFKNYYDLQLRSSCSQRYVNKASAPDVAIGHFVYVEKEPAFNFEEEVRVVSGMYSDELQRRKAAEAAVRAEKARVAALEAETAALKVEADRAAASLVRTGEEAIAKARWMARLFKVGPTVYRISDCSGSRKSYEYLQYVQRLGEAERRDLLIRFRDWMARWPLRDANLHIDGDEIICTVETSESYEQMYGTWRNHITTVFVERV